MRVPPIANHCHRHTAHPKAQSPKKENIKEKKTTTGDQSRILRTAGHVYISFFSLPIRFFFLSLFYKKLCGRAWMAWLQEVIQCRIVHVRESHSIQSRSQEVNRIESWCGGVIVHGGPANFIPSKAKPALEAGGQMGSNPNTPQGSDLIWIPPKAKREMGSNANTPQAM